MNAQSIVNKTDPYQMQLNDSNIDICAITETWLKIDDDLTMKMVPPPNIIYTVHQGQLASREVDWPWSRKPYKCYT